MKDHLLLKWGTLKGWCFENSPKAMEALKRYAELGMSLGAAQQRDTPEQKELICKMIDGCRGPISNDWEGTTYKTKKAAKEYIMNYGK